MGEDAAQAYCRCDRVCAKITKPALAFCDREGVRAVQWEQCSNEPGLQIGFSSVIHARKKLCFKNTVCTQVCSYTNATCNF